jgi:hypothetical protein
VGVSVGVSVKVGSGVFVGRDVDVAVMVGLVPTRLPHALNKIDAIKDIYIKRCMAVSSWFYFPALQAYNTEIYMFIVQLFSTKYNLLISQLH